MHRSGALKLLAAHRALALPSEEAVCVDKTIAFIKEHPDCLLRTCLPGHLTGSAWILSPDRRRTLLTHHGKLGKWLQLGGHADGDPDLLAVALRRRGRRAGFPGSGSSTSGSSTSTATGSRPAGPSPGTGTTTCGSCSRPTRRSR